MGMLDGKLAQDDIQRVKDKRHHPQYESGFDDDFTSGGDDMDGGFDMNDLFSSDDGGGDLFGSDSGSSGGDTFGSFGAGNSNGSNPFGSSGGSTFGNTGGSTFGQTGGNTFGGGSNTFGGNGFSGGNTFGGNGTFGGGSTFGNAFGSSPFGQVQQGQQQQASQPDTFDKAIDAGAKAAESLGQIFMEMIKSVKLRNADDFGYLSNQCIITGGFMIPLGLILGIIGTVGSIDFLKFTGFSTQLMLCGGLLFTSGIIGIATSSLILMKADGQESQDLNAVPDIPDGEDNFTSDYENNIGDELDDLFADLDDSFSDTGDDLDNAEPEEPETLEESEEDLDPEPIDFESRLEEIGENKYMSRETLFNTFKGLLPTCTPKFSEVKEILPDTNDFDALETICLKALSNLTNLEIEEIDSHLESASENQFSYEMRLKRINKVRKTDELAKEIEIYMSNGENPINVTVTLEGDFYKIIVSKGNMDIVTFGDVFKNQDACNFFLNTKHKLPIITGIDDIGTVILDDAKDFDTMLVCGKPRSGKSWFVLSILMNLMMFNTPEDVLLLIIDPKESNLFKTIALMPHVLGLHNSEHILDVLDDIIEIEAPRRKALLDSNRCDTVWDLRAKKIMVPILYIIIDEYITAKASVGDRVKELDTKIQMIITQFPSLGIRLIIIPHRSQGIVDKTNRTNFSFTAAVRADKDIVEEALGVKWNRPLTRPGDTAIKTSNSANARFVRSAAVTPSDEENSVFIETVAKAFYKMGVDIPDMHSLRIACNRDEDKIKQELGDTASTRVQYNAENILNDIEDMDFSSI